MVQKLAILCLHRGIGSMDYIDTLMIMEDDLDDDDLGEFGESLMTRSANNDPTQQDASGENTQQSTNNNTPDWCVCGRCRQMTQEIENKCCKLKKCITLTSRFTKLYLNPDIDRVLF